MSVYLTLVPCANSTSLTSSCSLAFVGDEFPRLPILSKLMGSTMRFHFGGRPHKRNYCFALTSLVLGGLHQRSGLALPTGGRADPAIGNEALAGTDRS